MELLRKARTTTEKDKKETLAQCLFFCPSIVHSLHWGSSLFSPVFVRSQTRPSVDIVTSFNCFEYRISVFERQTTKRHGNGRLTSIHHQNTTIQLLSLFSTSLHHYSRVLNRMKVDAWLVQHQTTKINIHYNIIHTPSWTYFEATTLSQCFC